uniref:Putative secreted protein n=1 Tax=Ixodes ricinus TaxID=34613 RepID=A0A6B0U7Y0_IXORI
MTEHFLMSRTLFTPVLSIFSGTKLYWRHCKYESLLRSPYNSSPFLCPCLNYKTPVKVFTHARICIH